MLPCHSGFAVPVHLAAHLHPSPATFHDGHRLYANPLHCWAAVELSGPSQRAPARGGETVSLGSVFHKQTVISAI